MHLPFFHLSQELTLPVTFLWSVWYLIVGIITGYIKQFVIPIKDKKDAYGRLVFSFIVLYSALLLGRLPETYLNYGSPLREGNNSIIWWTTSLVIGLAIHNLILARNKYVLGK
jgi:hypothetical protein